MAITIETAGREATRTPASPPSRVRQAIEEYAVSAARRSTTTVLLAGLRVGQVDLGGDRGRDLLTQVGGDAGGDPVRRQRASRPSPARRSPGPPGAVSPGAGRRARRGWTRSPRTSASVGPRPQSSSERSTTGPSTSRSKPIGLSNRSSSGPSATMGSGSVSQLVGRHLVGRLLGQDEAALAGVVGPDRLPAELGDDSVHGHRCVEPQHGEPAAVDGPGPDHGAAPATPDAGSARAPSCPRRARPPVPWCAPPSGRAARGARHGRAR